MKGKLITNDIMLIDNFLTDEELVEVKKEIVRERGHIEYKPETIDFTNTVYHRLYLDEKYMNRRKDSLLLGVIEKHLFSDEVYNILMKDYSYPFQTLYRTRKHETQLTVYPEGGKYNWHRDNDRGRIISYVLPIDIKKRQWTGGELIVKTREGKKTIKPKENQLIIFSGHLAHKVTPIKMKKVDKDLLAGRVILNGHAGY